MRIGHEIQVPFQRGIPVASSRSIPPVRNAVVVCVPGRAPRDGGEILQSAGVVFVVDQAGLARDRALVCCCAVEGFLDDACVVLVAGGLGCAAVGEDALVCLCGCLLGYVGEEESASLNKWISFVKK